MGPRTTETAPCSASRLGGAETDHLSGGREGERTSLHTELREGQGKPVLRSIDTNNRGNKCPCTSYTFLPP